MDKYIFREVLCPFCKKPYMTRIYEDYDCTVKYEEQTLNGGLTDALNAMVIFLWWKVCMKALTGTLVN